MSLLRLVGQGGKRRLEKEIVLPIEQLSDVWLMKTFFALKKEGMRRNLLSRYGYRKKTNVRDKSESETVLSSGVLHDSSNDGR